eukprot:m.208601 g.208601  ORF g.208601 m.208601 type:complete len:640 (-) comp33014_c0_seq2:278-2197(-)
MVEQQSRIRRTSSDAGKQRDRQIFCAIENQRIHNMIELHRSRVVSTLEYNRASRKTFLDKTSHEYFFLCLKEVQLMYCQKYCFRISGHALWSRRQGQHCRRDPRHVNLCIFAKGDIDSFEKRVLLPSAINGASKTECMYKYRLGDAIAKMIQTEEMMCEWSKWGLDNQPQNCWGKLGDDSSASSENILGRILFWLGDERSLGRASQVCRSWHSFVSKSKLWELLLWQHFEIEFQSLRASEETKNAMNYYGVMQTERMRRKAGLDYAVLSVSLATEKTSKGPPRSHMCCSILPGVGSYFLCCESNSVSTCFRIWDLPNLKPTIVCEKQSPPVAVCKLYTPTQVLQSLTMSDVLVVTGHVGGSVQIWRLSGEDLVSIMFFRLGETVSSIPRLNICDNEMFVCIQGTSWMYVVDMSTRTHKQYWNVSVPIQLVSSSKHHVAISTKPHPTRGLVRVRNKVDGSVRSAYLPVDKYAVDVKWDGNVLVTLDNTSVICVWSPFDLAVPYSVFDCSRQLEQLTLPNTLARLGAVSARKFVKTWFRALQIHVTPGVLTVFGMTGSSASSFVALSTDKALFLHPMSSRSALFSPTVNHLQTKNGTTPVGSNQFLKHSYGNLRWLIVLKSQTTFDVIHWNVSNIAQPTHH